MQAQKYEQLTINGGGTAKSEPPCPKCRNKYTQAFPSKKFIYYRCLYCKNKWSVVR